MLEIVNFITTIFHKLKTLISFESENQSEYHITLVMGNATCDMDSFLSALTLSYFRNIQSGFITVSESSEITYNIKSEGVNHIHIPFINCPKGELFWRLDIAEIVKKLDIEDSEFFYVNYDLAFKGELLQFKPLDADLSNLERERIAYDVILVDHHELDPSQRNLSPYVVEILDHHDDKEFSYSVYKNLMKKRVEFPRCSNMNLILEEFFSNKTLKKTHDSIFADNFFDIFVSAQLLDTSNFDEKLFDIKWVAKDKHIVSEVIESMKKSIFSSLVEQTHFSDNLDFEHGERLYNILSSCKFDHDKNLELGITALLNKDLKNFEIELAQKNKLLITYASFPIPLKHIVDRYSKDEFIKHLESYANTNGTECFVIIYQDDKKNVCAFNYVTLQGLNNHKNLLAKDQFLAYKEHLNKAFVESQTLPDLSLAINHLLIERSYMFTTKGKLSRKLLWPEMNKYLTGK